MADDHEKKSAGLQWKWIVLGIIVGLVITGSSFFILMPLLQNQPAQMIGMIAGFVSMGLLIGFFSPGIMPRETVIAAVVLLAILAGLLVIADRLDSMGRDTLVYWAVLNLNGGLLGGWIGRRRLVELHAGRDHTYRYVRFPWRVVGIGTSIGLAFSLLFLFVLSPLFKINENVIHVGFLVGFLASGFAVGFKSERMTMKEPALTGGAVALVNAVLLRLATTTGISVMFFSLSLGFLLTFNGAWFGERFRRLLTKSDG